MPDPDQVVEDVVANIKNNGICKHFLDLFAQDGPGQQYCCRHSDNLESKHISNLKMQAIKIDDPFAAFFAHLFQHKSFPLQAPELSKLWCLPRSR